MNRLIIMNGILNYVKECDGATAILMKLTAYIYGGPNVTY